MLDIEHLIENAIHDCRSGKNLSNNEFLSDKYNKDMLANVSATREELWYIAQYIVYTHDTCARLDFLEEAEQHYGYPMPND